MFTRTELNVLLSALRNWEGPYCSGSKLNEKELARVDRELSLANDLAARFQEILQDYYEMENKHLEQV